MQTARFEQLRKRALERVFNKKRVVKVWRDIVRDQLRSQDIKDLYDFYDINFNIEERVQSVRADILKGAYKASRPFIYRLEKKLGICRHMVIPQPLDALVLQVLTEEIADEVVKRQPSENAFYSRTKHRVSKPHEVAEYGLGLWGLWVKLQKTIYNFSSGKKLIVNTDLSNYYDSIDIDELKKVLLTYTKTDEVVIDLLFGVVKEVSWQPDYLPYSGRGLPTSGLDAIRLLAHMFLYEVDEVLKEKSGDCFTRWMDDIVVGVDTHKEAKEIICATSDMLKSRGLALNVAKTNIHDQSLAFFHFQFKENQFLDNLIVPKTQSAKVKLALRLSKRFKKHKKNTSARSWDKVTKRYINFFGKIKSEAFLPEVVPLYIKYPSLRANLINYLLTLEYSAKTARKVMEILDELDIFDDISLYQICHLVTEWEIPDNKWSKIFLKSFEEKILISSFKRTVSTDFYSLLWFKAKYSEPDALLAFLIKYQNIWQSDAFLRRQATALFSRVYLVDKVRVEKLLSALSSSGEGSSVSLANQILAFSKIDRLSPRINLYLFPMHRPKKYPLSKFLVLCSLLNSDVIRLNPSLVIKIIDYIKDPYYKKYLEEQYGIR